MRFYLLVFLILLFAAVLFLSVNSDEHQNTEPARVTFVQLKQLEDLALGLAKNKRELWLRRDLSLEQLREQFAEELRAADGESFFDTGVSITDAGPLFSNRSGHKLAYITDESVWATRVDIHGIWFAIHTGGRNGGLWILREWKQDEE